jgi:hypothetical protein
LPTGVCAAQAARLPERWRARRWSNKNAAAVRSA